MSGAEEAPTLIVTEGSVQASWPTVEGKAGIDALAVTIDSRTGRVVIDAAEAMTEGDFGPEFEGATRLELPPVVALALRAFLATTSL